MNFLCSLIQSAISLKWCVTFFNNFILFYFFVIHENEMKFKLCAINFFFFLSRRWKSCGTIWISPTSFKCDFICLTGENELLQFTTMMIMAMRSVVRRRRSFLARTVTLWCRECTGASQSGIFYSLTGRDFMAVKVWTFSRVPRNPLIKNSGRAVKRSIKKDLISTSDMKAFIEYRIELYNKNWCRNELSEFFDCQC